MTYEAFLSRLEGVHRNGKQASAKCPAHEDNTASLSVSQGEGGKILLHCHAGCSPQQIAGALGLSPKDLFPEAAGKREIVCHYDYQDEKGGFLYRKTRWRMPDGSKSFTWSHKGKSGWKSGRGGEPVLYNLPALKEAELVYLVEGEKDVETLKGHGLPAASPPDGAKSKWRPGFTEALRGKKVVILEDNDEPGHEFAQMAAAALQGAAASVKVIDLTREWDNLPRHGDISDVFQAYDPKAVICALQALEAFAPEGDSFFSCFKTLAEFEEEEAKWVVPGWIPEGQITLLAADGGSGKTTAWCNILAALSAGKPCFLDPPGHTRKPLKVAFFTTEDSVRVTLRKAMRLAGANMENIITPDFLTDKEGQLRGFKLGTEKMERFIRHFRPALCVLDPVQGFIPPELNMGSRNAMRDCTAPLITLGEECKTASIVVCHTNKRKGAYGRDRIADSADLWDVSRSVIMIGQTGEDGLRYFSNEKNNYAPLQETILFSIDGDKQLTPQGTTWKRDREYMQDAQAARSSPCKEECREAVLNILEENNLKMPSKDLEDKLKAAGFSRTTINRAKADLKESSKIKYVNEGSKNGKNWFVEKTEFSEPDNEIEPPTVRELKVSE